MEVEMAPPWKSTNKTVSVSTGSQSPPITFSTTYIPPHLPTSAVITPVALFASMARCAALRRVAPAITAALVTGSTALLEVLVDDNGPDFNVEADIDDLADFEHTGLAGRVGNGFTDVYMSVLGYAWRDLASALVSTGGRLADFIYDGVPIAGYGVALVEAKGSLSASATQPNVTARARNGYKTQVEKHLGASSVAGQIVHGYAVSFGAVPPRLGATSHVVQTSPPSIPAVFPPSPAGSAAIPLTTPVAARLAFGNYRAVFMLANAPVIFYHLDRLTNRPSPQIPLRDQIFERRQSGDRWFLVGRNPEFQHTIASGWRNIFAIEEAVAESFLNQLAAYLRTSDGGAARAMFSLPTHDPALLLPPEHPSKQSYLLYPDGFALLIDWLPSTEARTWSKDGGLGPPHPLSSDPPVLVR